MNFVRFRAPILLGLCLATSCVVTESGNPPIIDTDLVLPFGALGDQFILNATSAVDPPGGDVFLANLSRGGLEMAPVDGEGSFNVQVTYQLEDSFRLQAIGADGQYSAPYDFRTTTGDDQLPLQGDLTCIRVELTGTGATLESGCPDARSLSLRMVRGEAVSPAAVDLAPGETLEVLFAAASRPDVLVLVDGGGFLQATTLR